MLATCSTPVARSISTDAAFPPGTVTRTLLGKVQVVLWRPERGGFELWVNGSVAPYAWKFLENAALEYGYTIAA